MFPRRKLKPVPRSRRRLHYEKLPPAEEAVAEQETTREVKDLHWKFERLERKLVVLSIENRTRCIVKRSRPVSTAKETEAKGEEDRYLCDLNTR